MAQLNENLSYFSEADDVCFANPNRNVEIDKLNRILKGMQVFNDTYADELVYVYPNNYEIKNRSMIGKELPEDYLKEYKSNCGMKIYKVIDNNASSERNVYSQGFVSPLDKSLTSYVAIPIVYVGKDEEHKQHPCRYDSDIEKNEYRPLYPPQWGVVRQNYPKLAPIIEPAIVKRLAMYANDMAYYDKDDRCYYTNSASRLDDLNNYTRDQFCEKFTKNLQADNENSYSQN